MTDTMYFVRDRGRVSGPFPEETLARFARTGRLARHHQVSPDRVHWSPASAALPGLFMASPPRALPPAEPPPGAGPAGDDRTPPAGPEPPQPPGRAPQPVLIAGLAALVALALMATGVGVAISLQPDRPWTAERCEQEAAPRVVVLQGMHESKGKLRMLGLAVGRNHVVMPLEAAELAMLKVESGDRVDRSWHGAQLQLVDVQAGLAGARADLGRKQQFFDVKADGERPRIEDTVYLVGVDTDDEPFIHKAQLEAIESKGGPDERLVVELTRDVAADRLPVGSALLDRYGKLVGVATARLGGRMVSCSTVAELAIKRQELRKMPADHSIDPITLPEPPPPPVPDGPAPAPQAPAPQAPAPQAPAPQAPAPQAPAPQAPAPQAPAPQAPAPQAPAPETPAPETPPPGKPAAEQPGEADDDAPRKKPPRKPSQGTADLLDAAGSLGERMLNETTDSSLPPLDDDTRSRLGREQLADILEQNPRCEDPIVARRVQGLFQEITKAARMSPNELVLTITADETVNAYAFVGGHLVITTGFVEFAGRDDEMICFVIAHELGHIALGHTDLPYRRAIAAGTLAALLHGAGEQVVGMSPISQAQERDADCFAVRAVRRAARSPEGGVRFFQRLDEQEQGDGTSDPILGAVFGSHPENRRRIEHIRHGCEGD